MQVPGGERSSFIIFPMLDKQNIKDYIDRSLAAEVPIEVIDLTLVYVRYCHNKKVPVDFNNIHPGRNEILNSDKISLQQKEYITRLDQYLRKFETIPQNYLDLYLWYSYNLLEKGYPVIFTVTNLAVFFNLSTKGLHFLSNSDKCYSTFCIPKPNGSQREINAPIPKLMWIQRWILENILQKISVSDANTAYTPGSSIIKNAIPHVGAKVVIKMDIESFFPSISFERVMSVYLEIGYVYSVALLLTKLSCHKGKLPQGAPTSPMLANIICRRLDLRLGNLAKKLGFQYTRYADDLTFSGNGMTDGLEKSVKKIVQSEGFSLSLKKTKVMRRNTSQRVTGLVINDKPNIPREYYRRIRAIIHNCIKDGVHKQNLEGDDEAVFKQRLYGYAYYIHSVNQKLGNNLLQLLEHVNWNS